MHRSSLFLTDSEYDDAVHVSEMYVNFKAATWCWQEQNSRLNLAQLKINIFENQTNIV